jgi:hypothetical protein
MKKVKKIAKKVKVTYGSRINDLYKYAEKLESFEYLYEYFLNLKDNRNCFVVEMRRLVSIDLQKEGLSITDIGLILSRDHASLIYLDRTEANDYVAAEVGSNYKIWIKDNVYPKSIRKKEVSYLHKNGFKTVIIYELNRFSE